MGKLIQMDVRRAEKLLRNTGLLWALNTLVLHPLGLALAFSYDDAEKDKPEDEQVPSSIILMETDDASPVTFAEEIIDEGRKKLGKLIINSLTEGRTPSNEPLLYSLAWPPPKMAHTGSPVRAAALVYLGDMVRQPVLDQMREMKERWGRHVSVDDILHIQVPRWLYEALAAVEDLKAPLFFGKPLVVGIAPAETVLVTFRTES